MGKLSLEQAEKELALLRQTEAQLSYLQGLVSLRISELLTFIMQEKKVSLK